jgi:hypothetical protein
MTADLTDSVALVRAIAWPIVSAGGLIIFRQPIMGLVAVVAQRVEKVSFAGCSLELASLFELRPRSLDLDLRDLDAATRPQSGPIDLLVQLKEAGSHDYIVIDLGSEASPRWLTSRLYLFGLLLARVSRLKCFVFVETVGGTRNRFVGIASPDAVRWAMARRYPWLEFAYAHVYAQIGIPQFDSSTGALSEWQASMIVQQFLAAIRVPGGIPIPFSDPNRLPDTTDLGNGIFEYAKWLDGARIERVLGADLSTASVQVPPGKTMDDITDAILRQKARFVAVLESDRTLRCVVEKREKG